MTSTTAKYSTEKNKKEAVKIIGLIIEENKKEEQKETGIENSYVVITEEEYETTTGFFNTEREAKEEANNISIRLGNGRITLAKTIAIMEVTKTEKYFPEPIEDKSWMILKQGGRKWQR